MRRQKTSPTQPPTATPPANPRRDDADQAGPAQYVPKSVEACETGQWTLVRWLRIDPARKVASPFRCRSWRCSQCAWGRSQDDARDLLRMLELNGAPDAVLFTVLTIDQGRFRGTKADGYRAVSPLLARFMHRMRRRFGRVEYVAVLEQHATGWVHVNLVLVSKGMRAAHAKDGKWKMRDLVRDQAARSGFGRIIDAVDPPRDLEDVVRYVGKAADRSVRDSRLAREVVKVSQLPVDAPRGTRRFRVSRGLERPPEEVSPWTGELVRAPFERVEAMIQHADLARAELARRRTLARSHAWPSPLRDTFPSGSVLSPTNEQDARYALLLRQGCEESHHHVQSLLPRSEATTSRTGRTHRHDEHGESPEASAKRARARARVERLIAHGRARRPGVRGHPGLVSREENKSPLSHPLWTCLDRCGPDPPGHSRPA